MPVAEKLATATDLQKKTGRVLDDAAKGPVSIQRPNKPAITLVKRDAWQDAANAKLWLSTYSAIVRYVVERASNESEPAYPTEFAWLRLFDLEDLREFLDELSSAIYAAIHGLRPWDDADAVVEEWRRSAAALDNEELRRRFKQTLGEFRD